MCLRQNNILLVCILRQNNATDKFEDRSNMHFSLGLALSVKPGIKVQL